MNCIRSFLTLVFSLTLLGAYVGPASAQSDGVTVFLRPVNASTGDSITDVCLVIVDFSNVGCDENQDGAIKFADVPPGDYDVALSGLNNYADSGPFHITVTSTPDTQQFQIDLAPLDGEGTSLDTVTVYLAPIDVTTGGAVTAACFVLIDFSNTGCDENGDGFISFEDVPPGIYGVHESQPAAGYLALSDFRINVHNDRAEQTFQIDMTPVRENNGTVDISVVPYDATTGGGLTGACVEFTGASLEGCDDNGDGRIDFKGVPVGSYQLTETTAPPGYQLADPRFVSVQQNGRVYYLEHYPGDQVQPAPQVDVALVTRDPKTGDLLNGSCYVILDASIEGCDENSDGQVDFRDVVPGTYTVHQTKAPSGFNRIDDFDIQISEFDPTQSILIKQSKTQYAKGFRNVSVAVYDINTGTRVTGPDVCVQLVDFSNVGCDLNSDGQIDFQDVPVGTYVIDAISLPNGYGVNFHDNKVIVEETNPFSIANALLTVTGP
jgi:uncharacterized surface anchored protein